MKAFWCFLATVLSMTVLFNACKKDDTTPPTPATTSYSAVVNGAQEKPTSTTSTGSGTFAGRLTNDTRVLSYTVTYAGLTTTTATAGHIHRITNADGTGPVVVPFPTMPASTTGSMLATSPISGTAVLRQSLIDSMNAGQTYVNLHTSRFPAGEIRGDIKR
ncbi:CHRD domain-containing protein [Nibrella viscosa]|uniref:CHRD domain-containing protein n=1 Tax=Nibrella viscosa TaxID=1084524 RepID=UPI0031EA7357